MPHLEGISFSDCLIPKKRFIREFFSSFELIKTLCINDAQLSSPLSNLLCSTLHGQSEMTWSRNAYERKMVAGLWWLWNACSGSWNEMGWDLNSHDMLVNYAIGTVYKGTLQVCSFTDAVSALSVYTAVWLKLFIVCSCLLEKQKESLWKQWFLKRD